MLMSQARDTFMPTDWPGLFLIVEDIWRIMTTWFTYVYADVYLPYESIWWILIYRLRVHILLEPGNFSPRASSTVRHLWANQKELESIHGRTCCNRQDSEQTRPIDELTDSCEFCESQACHHH
jgi:hypothetical protein